MSAFELASRHSVHSLSIPLMTPPESARKRIIILYDSKTYGGSTDRFVDALGRRLAETGAYVEKARCKHNGDYSFLSEFDIVIMGAPVYYLMVSSELLGALLQSNLKQSLNGRQIALFLTCGSPELMANLLYMPQLKLNLIGQNIVTEKIFAPDQLANPDLITSFVENLSGVTQP